MASLPTATLINFNHYSNKNLPSKIQEFLTSDNVSNEDISPGVLQDLGWLTIKELVKRSQLTHIEPHRANSLTFLGLEPLNAAMRAFRNRASKT